MPSMIALFHKLKAWVMMKREIFEGKKEQEGTWICHKKWKKEKKQAAQARKQLLHSPLWLSSAGTH